MLSPPRGIPVHTDESSAASPERRLSSLGSVAIVHDYLNQRGGAERVVAELSEIWPSAPIYTSLYRKHSTFRQFEGRDVRTTFIDRLPRPSVKVHGGLLGAAV